jgi:hypothetical protein
MMSDRAVRVTLVNKMSSELVQLIAEKLNCDIGRLGLLTRVHTFLAPSV